MFRLTRGEESKLTSWYFETDRKMIWWIMGLVLLSFIMMFSAGSAEAARLSYPWYHFILKALPFYILGLGGLFFFSLLNKKWILRISWLMLIVGIVGLIATLFFHGSLNGSQRWLNLGYGIRFMPADILKPAFIMIFAWFLTKLKSLYGENIFFNAEAWNPKQFSWWPFLVIFALCFVIMFKHPDVGTAILFFGVALVMCLLAGFPWKKLTLFGLSFIGIVAGFALLFMPHIRLRFTQMFDVAPRTQVWYSLNSIRHGGLFGKGDESFVKDVLPEATNDFIFSSIVEDWGAVTGCLLIFVLFVILNKLLKYAYQAKDDFVLYALVGTAALFGGQVCFNLMTALHIFINKGMTLPFVSYGGGSFVCFSVLFGMILALIREDSWHNR